MLHEIAWQMAITTAWLSVTSITKKYLANRICIWIVIRNIGLFYRLTSFHSYIRVLQICIYKMLVQFSNSALPLF